MPGYPGPVDQSPAPEQAGRPTLPSGQARRPSVVLEQNVDPEILGDGHAPGQYSRPSLEVSNAISRLHKEYVGRGPTNVRTTIDGDLVVCLLEGGYTKAEQTLEKNNKTELVAAGRIGLQEAMREAMNAAVTRALGRTVRSFMSANDLHQNLQVEVFVLTPAVESGTSAHSA